MKDTICYMLIFVSILRFSSIWRTVPTKGNFQKLLNSQYMQCGWWRHCGRTTAFLTSSSTILSRHPWEHLSSGHWRIAFGSCIFVGDRKVSAIYLIEFMLCCNFKTDWSIDKWQFFDNHCTGCVILSLSSWHNVSAWNDDGCRRPWKRWIVYYM